MGTNQKPKHPPEPNCQQLKILLAYLAGHVKEVRLKSTAGDLVTGDFVGQDGILRGVVNLVGRLSRTRGLSW